jgi:Trm5-related predicted tRNA methylase
MTRTATTARKEALEAIISKAVGEPVEITIRNVQSFTFSTDKVSYELPSKIADYFGDGLHIDDYDHDHECGSFVYATCS